MKQDPDAKQAQTGDAFAYKWSRRESYESEAMQQKSYRWLVERYFGSEAERERFLEASQGSKILDAGCGSGYSALLLFGEALNGMDYLGVDISDAVNTAGERFREKGIKGRFLKGSISEVSLTQRFDIIFCEGVLHHTSAPYEALNNLLRHLRPGGTVMFYVYRRKAPVREHTDDFIRSRLQSLDDAAAWEKIMPLTRLGKALGDLGAEVEVEEDVDLLEIPRGRYPVQRLFYWFFLKLYYDPEFTLEEMNHVNFDWYRPLNCHRFAPEEIERWLQEMELRPVRFVAERAGITVVAEKQVVTEGED